ncbi:MAG: N-acetylmuramoyl-L-alanine amidase [Bacillota bacterium]
MEALLTNMWTTVRPSPSGQALVSAVVLESTRPPTRWHLETRGPLELELHVEGLALNFPPARLPVLDGLVHEVSVGPHDGAITTAIHLDHPSAPTLALEGDGPFRLLCWFDRSLLRQIMGGVKVLVDPGHGGKDAGGRGPINLVEKNVTLKVARYLVGELRAWGAHPLVTRHDDRDVPASHRFLPAREGQARIVVSLHTDRLRDPTVRGVRTLYWTSHPGSRDLAHHIHHCLLERTGFPSRGVRQARPPDPRVAVPAVTVELVCISNMLDEAWLRSTTFLARAAQAITRGIKDYLFSTASQARPPETRRAGVVPQVCFSAIPVRTHVLSEQDDMVQVVARYTRGIAEPGDVICVAESPLAVTQGRAIVSSQVKPGLAARVLSKFPDPDGSLGTPQAMQLAISEVGLGRILVGGLAAALGRAAGRRGDFFRVAGQALAQIDDIAGTMPPYDRHVVLGPRDPQKVADSIKRATGVDALVADVNDIRCVDILGSTSDYPEAALTEALRENPFGNDDQCTPIVVLKPLRRDH